jgi:two-component system, cell cycle sensor histidine kinase and response regulator CckA
MLVENSLQGLAIMQDQRIVFCNKKFSEMSGYSIQELLAFTPDQNVAMVHPKDRTVLDEHVRNCQEGKSVLPSLEYRVMKKGGGETWLEVCSSPIEHNGKPALQSAFMNITERKNAEEALRDSKEYLDRIINCLGDPVFIKDEKNRVTLANKAFCAFTGKRPDELVGKKADQFLLDERMDSVHSVHNEEQIVFETGREFVSQEEIPDKDGNIRTVLTKKTLLQDRSGRRQIVEVLRDITDYKRLEAQFLQVQKMEAIGVLAGGVAHDFNNLLSVIRGYTELLMEEFEPGDQRREDLDQIEKAGQRAASLISQLLAFSRKKIFQPEILNLNAIVSDMSKMLRRLIGEDIELTTVAQPELSFIHADPGQIQQIMMNLAINARDAMPKGGRLTIKTANAYLDDEYVRQHPAVKKGFYVMLAISDNGIGMDEATQARIFEPFFSTKENKGVGLGLSTIYGIVKQSNGLIWVYSELGKGATFKIYFPAVEEKSFRSVKDDLSEGECEELETVLIAEDEEAVRDLACRILRARGYTVLEASNGRHALDVARQYSGKIDMVLTDVIMPEMDGSALVSQLKAMRPGIKALFFSGYTDGAIVQHGILDPNVDFLQKPFSASGLVRKLREVIDAPLLLL